MKECDLIVGKRIIRSLCVLFIAFIITIGLHVQQEHKYKDWITTQGTLYQFEEIESHFNHPRTSPDSYRLYYTYEVDGVEYSGMDSISGKLPVEYYIGKTVEIMYDSKDPASSLQGKPRTHLITRIPFMWLTPIALLLLLPMKRGNRKQKDFWVEMEKRGMGKKDAENILNKWKNK